MSEAVKQAKNSVTNGDIVGGDKTTVHNYQKPTKLSALFDKLKMEFGNNNTVDTISDNLSRYSEPRDIIGLEEKLIAGDRKHLLDDASWLKQEYYKKLTKFQFFEPAQEIHAFLLGVVLEKFRNFIYPMMRLGTFSDIEISKTISLEIVNPIIKSIQDEGCDDVMGLSSTDIEGMIYFLTGHCHIKWEHNGSVSSGI